MTGYLLPLAIGAALVTGTMAEKNPYDAPGQNGAYLTGYAGVYNVFSDHDTADRKRTGVGGMEYRFAPIWGYGIRPTIGALVDFKGDAYGYGGFTMDVPLYQDRLWFIPGAAVGAYEHNNGRDLGGALEFRTSAELAYRFDNNQRLGVVISHLSNANIYNENPGTEMITANYSIPISAIWK